MADNQQQAVIPPEHQPQVEDDDPPPAAGNAPAIDPRQRQQIVSDDGLERHPQGGFHAHAPMFLPHQQQAMAMAQYYEARMRDHAAAYASAAAGAAWAAAQIAVSAQLPPTLPPPIMNPPTYVPTCAVPHQDFSPYHAPPYDHHFNFPPRHPSSELAPEERPIKRHHRMPLGSNIEQQERRGRRRQRVDFSSSSDGGRFNLKSQRHKNKNPCHNHNSVVHSFKKSREKLNLLGKTGVSALHEWCVHCKKMPPKFVILPTPSEFFCFAAYVDDLEWSRGRGATKASAKQDAARKALQALIPGVVFDDAGLVMDMTANEAMEDLPNLAERLAIDSTKKRRCGVYPGTSTTTDDDVEDENAYYANRGASLFSALVHAMWQINNDIPEPPSYSYDVPTNSRREGSRPSSFSCTATLNLIVRETIDAPETEIKENAIADENLDAKPKVKRKVCIDIESSKRVPIQDNGTEHVSHGDLSMNSKRKVLTGVGIGSTKREARHVASAKLLSLLFPQCEGMMEVKACAEAARERYAASKALKLQTKRFGGSTSTISMKVRDKNSSVTTNFLVEGDENPWNAKPSDPALPQSVINIVRSLTGREVECPYFTITSRVEDDEVSVESLSLSEKVTVSTSESSCNPSLTETRTMFEARALSRQLQLETMVDNALQTLNEYDEVGRSLPHEPNYDDVGRTVLRRAEAADIRFLNKLLLTRGEESLSSLSPMQAIVTGGSSSLFWGPTCFAVLLCRAIASHDEPPLGCAILTLGLTLARGRVLRVAEIESERHLPRERFVECLQQFAVNMKCQLNIEPSSVGTDNGGLQTMTKQQLSRIVESYLKRTDFLCNETGSKQLQSVKEEEPDVDEEVKEKSVESVKDKPSKRSRID